MKRACVTLLSVWLLAFFVCAISAVYDDHRALVSENQRLKHPQLYTEPSNSLRKRTVQLADDLEAFEIGRANKRQFLLQSLPSQTPEQDILRNQKLREFDIETSSEYVKQGLRERTVGVLQELRGKGLDIEWLGAEGAAPVRPLVGDELRILRDLAYYLDEKGNAFRIEGASGHP